MTASSVVDGFDLVHVHVFLRGDHLVFAATEMKRSMPGPSASGYKYSLDPADLVHLVLGSELESSSDIGQEDLFPFFGSRLRGSAGRSLGSRRLSGRRFLGGGRLLGLVLDVLGGLHVLSPSLLTRLTNSLGGLFLERLSLERDGGGPTAKTEPNIRVNVNSIRKRLNDPPVLTRE
jgi:hypothetical protein